MTSGSPPMAPTQAGVAAAPSIQAASSLALPTPSSITASDNNSAPQDLVGHLELRISANSVGLYPPPPEDGINSDVLAMQAMSIQHPPNTTGDRYICLLRGPLDDFLKYSRQEHSKWLIDIAHDVCDPALRRGSLLVWNSAVRRWSPVATTDPLTASIYRYDVPAGVIVGLSKMSARTSKSVTAASGAPSTMANRVKRRDGGCWVTGFSFPLINSHVCPKRMGDHLSRIIFHTFSPTSPPIPDLSIYDERFGISLTPTLDAVFDVYKMGLRFVSVDQYECHVFAEEPNKVLTTSGMSPVPASDTIVHGHTAGPPQPQLATNPPPGLICWHYLQCVLKKFGHADYKMLPNISFYEMPFRTEDDSDDSNDGTDSNTDWPTAALDRGRAVQASIEDAKHHHKLVVDWLEKV